MLASLVVAFLPFAQQARPPVALSSDSDPLGVQLASDEELSVALWASGASNVLRLASSDGRALAWSAPLTVKSSTSDDFIAARAIEVDGDDAVAVWTDDRNYKPSFWPIVALTAFARRYDPATHALGPELVLATGSPPELTTVQGVAVDVARVGAALHVHVALAIQVWSFHGSQAYDRILLFTSLDGAASFLPPITVNTGTPVHPGGVAIAALGDTVHVAWIDSRDATPQIYYQRSSDAGASIDFASDRQLTSGAHKLGFAMDAQGSTLAFAFTEHIPDFTFRGLSALVSLDAGATFGPVNAPPNLNPLGDIPDNPTLEIAPSGASVLVAWDMLSAGVRQAMLSRSTDGGLSWTPPGQLSQGAGRYPSLAVSEPGRTRVVAAWQDQGIARTRVSLDEGATWSSEVPLSAGPMYAYARPNLAWNERYQNAIAGWASASAPHTTWVGGLRPQRVAPVGFTPGSSQVGAQCAGFDDGNAVAFVLASLAPGSFELPFGDGRELGLTADALFVTTLGSAAHGSFAAVLDASGSGATPGLGVLALPAGLSLELVGLSVDLGTLSFGDISDVVHVQL
ncbi:MAG: exo-alpha-sialidase [Planctomycetota bacterium]|nr:MAG: exo-alpha-sialidase [Planctomycetota bacterium]